jgi:HK97 family phage prohead protease
MDIERAYPSYKFDGTRGPTQITASATGYECKALRGQFKADLQSRRVELWIASYGNVDRGGDLIAPGAAAKTIADRMPAGLIKFLWEHWTPLGPVESLEETPQGLKMVAHVTDDPSLDVYLKHIANGTAAHASIGYWAKSWSMLTAEDVRSQYGADPGHYEQVRVITEMEVREGSAVLWPMNEASRVVSAGKNSKNYGADGSPHNLDLDYLTGLVKSNA